MRFVLSTAIALMVSAAATVYAQQPIPPAGTIGSQTSVTPAPTQEMWFYEQYMKNYRDPQLAVRRQAEFRQQQRDNRLAAMKWFGMSNARPRTSPDPFNGDYSPFWASGNRMFPYQWNAVGPNYLIVPRGASAEK